MKKILIGTFIAGSFLFANTIKDNKMFVKVSGGTIKIHDTDSVESIGVGYYFYEPNKYNINNRISVDFTKVNSDADFYVTSLKLDWIKNTFNSFAPFVGLNGGYLYFKDAGKDYSTNVWGVQGGILYEITYNINIEAEFCYQKAFEKQKLWNSALKTFKIGAEFSF